MEWVLKKWNLEVENVKINLQWGYKFGLKKEKRGKIVIWGDEVRGKKMRKKIKNKWNNSGRKLFCELYIIKKKF